MWRSCTVNILTTTPKEDPPECDEPSQTSKKRAGSPFDDDTNNGLNTKTHLSKRLKTDNQPDDTVEPLASGSQLQTPTDEDTAKNLVLSNAIDSHAQQFQFSSLNKINDLDLTREKNHVEPRSSSEKLRGGSRLDDFQHQASIYPTPQTGNLNDDDNVLELPPLQLRDDGSQIEQGRSALFMRV